MWTSIFFMFLEGLDEENEEDEEEGEEALAEETGRRGRGGGVGLRLRAPKSMLVMLPEGERMGGGRGACESV